MTDLKTSLPRLALPAILAATLSDGPAPKPVAAEPARELKTISA